MTDDLKHIRALQSQHEVDVAERLKKDAFEKRSAAAKRAAETRKRNQRAKILDVPGVKEAIRENAAVLRTVKRTTYIQNSRVARWALSGVSMLAMMRGAPRRV